jgi:hypothetical protein
MSKRVEVAGQPVVANSSQKIGGLVTGAYINASAGELVDLRIYGQAGFVVLDHRVPGKKKISPSREASGLIMMGGR